MRIAVMSDIHGNAQALRIVLESIRENGIHDIVIAGDFVGYYYRADEVFSLLEKWRWKGVQGNHDAMLGRLIKGEEAFKEEYRLRYGSGLEIASRTLTADQITLLAQLPERQELIYNGCRILLCHGSPWKQDEYVYPNASDEVFERIAKLGYDVVIMGHTHWPIVRTVGSTLIVNPGSVGQPRDEGSSASWAVLDTDIVSAAIHRTRFSPAEIIEDATRYDSGNKYLIEVLTRARSPYAK